MVVVKEPGRETVVRTLFFGATVLFALGCDESLPPQLHPDDIDPADLFEITVEPIEGQVFYNHGDTVSASAAGTLVINVKNIHDEVFSGPENISIEADFWPNAAPSHIVRVNGDRNNLVNRFDFQGEVFMLDGDILTLLPDTTAQFIISWDHTDAKFYQYGNPSYEGDGCPNPPCANYVATDPILMRSKASILLFESQQTRLVTDEISFSIFYFFRVSRRANAIIDSLEAWLDSAAESVGIQWRTTFESSVHGFSIERAQVGAIEYEDVQFSFVPAMGGVTDTTFYYSIDSDPMSGNWYYRVAVIEDMPVIGAIQVKWSESIEVVIP